jgi:4-amino-4-deoxy-L-arabinose transferase-like glycosyltransferase
LLVAAFYKLFGPNPLLIRLFQAVVVGILQPYLAYLLGRRIFNEWVGLAAALFTAVYIYFIYYTVTLMTEPFYIVAIMASLYLTILMAQSDKKHVLKYALVLGLILGVTVLLRQLYLLFIPFQLLWLLWARFKHNGRVPMAEALLAGIVVAAMILPFTYYNYTRFDRFVLLNTNSGYAFYVGNHPVYGTQFVPILDDYTPLIPDDLALDNMDEASLDTEFLKRGIQFVIDDPVRYGLLSLSRIPIYFTFWPTSDSGMISNISRVGSFGLLLPFMIYGLVLALYRNWTKSLLYHPMTLLLLLAFIYTAVHVLTWTLVRYRLPVDALMVVFAGVGVVDLVRRLFPKMQQSLEVGLSQ